MSQKLPVDGLKWVENTSQFSKYFIENYNEDSDEEHFLEADVQYLELLHELHNDLLFLPERMNVKNLHDKKEYFIQKRHLKQVLNHGLVLKKVYKVIKFNQKAWLKSYIDMST